MVLSLFSIATFTSYALFTNEVEGQNTLSLTVSTAGRISIRIFAQDDGTDVGTLKEHINTIIFDVKPGYQIESFSCTTGESSYDKKTNILTINNATQNGSCNLNFEKIINLSTDWKEKANSAGYSANNFIALYTLDTISFDTTKTYNELVYNKLGDPIDVSEQNNGKVLLQVYSNGSNQIAVIGQEGGVIAPVNSRYLFGTEDETNPMNFKVIDLGNLYTSQVIDMYGMFCFCSLLTNLNLSNFDTSQVKNISYLFYECNSLANITGLDKFDTSQVTNMHAMFTNCIALTSINLSNFRTLQVKEISFMFYGCNALTTITGLDKFDTSQVTNTRAMFYGCSSLTNLDLSHFDTSQVTSMAYMFYNCVSLTKLNLVSFNTAKVTDMTNMFSHCTGLQNATDGKGVYVSADKFKVLDWTSLGLANSKFCLI